MTRININGAGHQVEIDHQGTDLAYVIEKAQKLWEDTKPPDGTAGPAYGFTAQVAGQQTGTARLWRGERPVVNETEEAPE